MRRKEQLIDHGLIKLFLFALVMLTPFSAWAQTITVGGVDATDATALQTAYGTTVSFDSQTNTLTLDNAQVNGTVSTSLTELNVHLKGHSVFSVETNSESKTYLFNGSGQSLTLNYSAESFGDVLEGIGTANSYKLQVAKDATTQNYDGTTGIWKNSLSVENGKDYCKLSKPYLYVGDTEIDKSNINNSSEVFSFDATNSSLTISETPNEYNNNAFLVKSNLANLTVNISDNIIYGLDNGTSTGRVFVYTGTDNISTLTLNIAEGKTLRTQWNNTSSGGNTGWINSGFSDTNISTDLSTMESSGVYAEETQASTEYAILFSNVELYDLSVSDTRVTSLNKDNILKGDEANDGKVSFNASSNTLTLDAADFVGISYEGADDLTISLKGDSKLSSITYSNENVSETPKLLFTKATGAIDCSLEIDCLGDGWVISGFSDVDFGPFNTLSSGPIKYDKQDPNEDLICLLNTVTNESIAKVVVTTATTYQLWVAGEQVNANNAGNVFVGTENAEKVSFTPAGADNGNTLTLNGAALTGNIISGLGDLTINIQNANTIAVSDTAAVIRSINGGKLTITKTGDSPTLVLSNTRQSYYHAPSIKDFASFELAEGLYLSNTRAYVSDDYSAPAVYDTYINNYGGQTTMGLINPTDMDKGSKGIRNVTVSTAVNYPIWVAHHKETVGAGYNMIYAQVNNTNKDDILGGDAPTASFVPASVDNDNINTLRLNGATILSAIVTSLPNLTIEFSGENSLDGDGKVDGFIHGVANSVLTFKAVADESEIQLYCANDYAVVEGFGDVKFIDAVAQYDGNFSYNKTTRRFENQYGAMTLLTISDDVTDYNLIVAGTDVTSLNASGIVGDAIAEGTVTFTPDDGTNGNILTLDGANLVSKIESGLDNLTILLKGNNNIQVDPTSSDQGINSTNTNATLKFAKGGDDCKLTISANTGVVSGFSNSSSPTMGEGLCWFPKLNENSVIDEAIVMDSPFAGGAGTSDSPFLIATYDQLKSFAGLVTDGTLTTQYVKLNANIDCSGKTDFEPIGTYTNPFKGTFDGNEKTISNLTMTNVNNDVVGFFTYNKGTITNLTLSGCTISGGSGSSNYIGMLVGENNGSVSGCTVKNSNVSCNADSQIPSVGGIAGITSNAITNCVVENTNVNAVTSDGGASGAVARAGGIAAYQNDGTVSGCVVKGTTTVASDYSNLSTLVYAGAIIGETGGTVSGNTYESTVVTKTRKQGDTDYTVKSGQTQRGFGNGDDVLEKVQLYGVKTVTVYVPDAIGNDGCKPVEGTYYMFNYPKIYVLPGSTFTYSMTPSNGYKPVFTLSDNTIAVTTEEKTNAESGSYDHTEFSFTMPETDLTATLSFAIDLASTNYTATIADVAYTSEAVVLGTVSLSYNDDEITPFTKDTQYTIEGYKSAKLEALDAAPVNVGTYHVTIKGVEAQGYTGTKDVQFNITQAENSLTTTPAAVAELAYTGEAQELVTAGVAKFGDVQYKLGADGTYSATIPTATDANTTGYTIYYKVEGTDNYAGIEEANVVVTIAKADATITKAPTAKDLTYTGEAQALVEAGTVSAGTMVYSTTLTGTFSETIPTGTNADTYSVYYKVNGNDNYNGIDASETNKVEVEIKKATITEVTLENPSLPYTGEEQTATIASVKAGDLVLTTNDYDVSNNKATNKGSYELTVTAKENSNFTGSKTATFSIGAANITDLYDISLAETSYVYDGTEHKPAVIFKENNEPVELSTDDYEVSYANNVDVGSAEATTGAPTVTVTGKGNLTGSKTLTFSITAMSLNNAIVGVASATYSGSEVEPTVTVKLTADSTPLELDKDYTVAYSNNINAATADATTAPTATITGKGNYTGSQSVKFTIDQKTVTAAMIDDIDNQTYTGSEITPTLTVKDGTTTMVLNTDYSVDYEDNVNVGIATATIIGEGNYKGTASKTFTIDPKELTADMVTLNPEKVEYNGATQKPEVTVADGTALTANDYTIENNGGVEVGKYDVVVTAKGNYTGKVTKQFEIVNRKLKAADVTFSENWASFYHPTENIDLPEGVAAYVLTAVGETTATATQISYIPAGVAVLLQNNVTTTTTNTSAEGNLMFHADEAVDVTTVGGTVYGLYNGKLMRVASGTIPAGKNFLMVSKPIGAPQLTITTDDTTAIEVLENAAALENGTDEWFTLDGRKLQQKPTKKGLYIKNGKTVVVNNK